MLQRKRQLQGDSGKPQAANWATLERARLTQERTLAIRRNDKEEVRILDAQLAVLALESPPAPTDSTEDASVLLAKVNERNRKANLEAIRRAEIQEAERKRRERRLGTPTALDPSARLRTVPRLFASRYVWCPRPRIWSSQCPLSYSGPRRRTQAGHPRQSQARLRTLTRPVRHRH
jgi:RNA polymerase-associated protein RTF1